MFKYLRWLICFPISVALTFVTWIIAPILALPIFVTVIYGREWLIKPLRWFQSFDHPLDEWRVVPRYNIACTWLDWDWDKPTHRYLARYFWLCRNPAYGFAQFMFGVEPTGIKRVWSYGIWDRGLNNYEFTLFDNCFHLTAQWFFYKKHFVRINIGWKEHAPFKAWMLATHISPFRKYHAPNNPNFI